MTLRRVVSWGAVGVCAVVVPLGLVIDASRAQDAPTKSGETLEQKVARLEREVNELSNRVGELERRSPALRLQPTPPGIGGGRPSLPPDSRPFTFNDCTYYWVPLSGRDKPVASVAPVRGRQPPAAVNPSAP
jgi:hypothetical protein